MAALASLVFALCLVGSSPGCTAPDVRGMRLARSDAPRSAPKLDASITAVAPALVDMVGTVVSDMPGRSSGREVVVVDASGEPREVVTNDDGVFTLAGVTPPYDIGVTSVSGAPATLYVGVRRLDPFVELAERGASTEPLPHRTLRIAVRLGRTPCSTSSGWVTVVTASASGGGVAVAPCSGRDALTVLDVEHVVRGPGDVAVGPVDVFVLVESTTAYAYARLVATLGDAGTTDVGSVEPTPIGVAPPMVVDAVGEASLLPDWRWMTAVALDIGGDPFGSGPTLFHVVAEGHSANASLPSVPGATMHASVFGRHPKGDGQGAFFRSTETWSGALAASAGPIELAVVAGPDVVRPKEGAHLSWHDVALEWEDATTVQSTSVATFSVRKATGNAEVLRVHAGERVVEHERLEALGVPALEAGDFWLELAASSGVTMDDVTSSDASTRSRRFDRSKPGALTLLRIPFVVGD